MITSGLTALISHPTSSGRRPNVSESVNNGIELSLSLSSPHYQKRCDKHAHISKQLRLEKFNYTEAFIRLLTYFQRKVPYCSKDKILLIRQLPTKAALPQGKKASDDGKSIKHLITKVAITSVACALLFYFNILFRG